MTALQIGVVIDSKYIIEGVLGEGASGIVYRAKHQAMDRMIALKVLKQTIGASEQALAAFRNEAVVVKSLQHPNVVQVYSIGLADSYCPYIAMELLDGKRLSDLIAEQGCLEADVVIPLFMQACAGLQHAHDMGIVHRDVKPSNMVVTPGRTEPVLKIVDFGVARNLGADSQAATSSLVGSALYFSPEALSGIIDRRSDIYSLGCSMYEALCGDPPFSGATFFEIAQKHSHQPLPIIASSHGRNAIPESLQNIVYQMLAKDADARYQSMSAVFDDLQRCLSGAPVAVPRRKTTSGGSNRRNGTISAVRSRFILASVAILAVIFSFAAYRFFFIGKGDDGWRTQVLSLIAKADKAQSAGDFEVSKTSLRKALELIVGSESGDETRLLDADKKGALECTVRQKYGTALRKHAAISGDPQELAEAVSELETAERNYWERTQEHIPRSQKDPADDARLNQQMHIILLELTRAYVARGQKDRAAQYLDQLLLTFDGVAAYGAKAMREMIDFLDLGIEQFVKEGRPQRAATFCHQRIRLQKLEGVSNATILADGKRYANLVRARVNDGAAKQFAKSYVDDTVRGPQQLFVLYCRDLQNPAD